MLDLIWTSRVRIVFVYIMNFFDLMWSLPPTHARTIATTSFYFAQTWCYRYYYIPHTTDTRYIRIAHTRTHGTCTNALFIYDIYFYCDKENESVPVVFAKRNFMACPFLKLNLVSRSLNDVIVEWLLLRWLRIAIFHLIGLTSRNPANDTAGLHHRYFSRSL